MTWQYIFLTLLGGGTVGGILSAILTFISTRSSNNISLLDRAYKEIERLDGIIHSLRSELAKTDSKLKQSEEIRKDLLKQLDQALWDLAEAKDKFKKLIEESKHKEDKHK